MTLLALLLGSKISVDVPTREGRGELLSGGEYQFYFLVYFYVLVQNNTKYEKAYERPNDTAILKLATACLLPEYGRTVP